MSDSGATEQWRPPRVSVALIAYRHDSTIEQAIRSILDQDYDDFELVVSDDHSPDETATVAARTIASDPRARLLPTERNIGMVANVRRSVDTATGEFVAFLEGDDYWTDVTKLRRQVEFLDAHPAMSAVGHLTTITTDDGTSVPFSDDFGGVDRLTADDVFAGQMPHASSLLFRRDQFPTVPPWFDGLAASDWSIVAWLALRGDIGLLQRDMSTYRKTQQSTSTPRPQLERKLLHLEGLSTFAEHQPSARQRLRRPIAKAHLVVAAVALHDRAWGLAIRHSVAGLRADPLAALSRAAASLRRKLKR